MTSFRTAATFAGDPELVLNSAITTLTNNGFVLTRRDAGSAALNSPGLNSTKQNAILGASSVLLSLSGNLLEVQAELGGVDRMQRFLTRFPLLLSLGIGLLLGVVSGLLLGAQSGVGFGVPRAQGWTWLLVTMGVSLLAVSPWFVLAPLIARALRQRVHAALETLVRDAAGADRHPRRHN